MTGSIETLLRSLKPWITLPLIALNGWVLLHLFRYFEPLITIFILAAVLAFVLNYPVRFLEKHGTKRGYAVLLVLLGSLIVLAGVTVTLIPAVLTQLSEIGSLLPTWVASLQEKLQLLEAWAVSRRLPVNVSQLVSQVSDRLPAELQALADQSVSIALSAVDSLTDVLLTGVLTFYLLLDGRRVWDGIFRWLPVDDHDRLRRVLQTDFHHYFIGQATLGLLMGVSMTLAFFILHVPYSLLLGLLVGAVTLIPFGDTVVLVTIGLLMATQDLGLGIRTLTVAVVVDQLVDQAVAPRVLGSITGLKPIWVLLSILVGTKVLGLAGLLTAVPLASFAKTLLDGGLEEPETKEAETVATIDNSHPSVTVADAN